MRFKKTTSLVALAASALLLTACGTGPAPTGESGSESGSSANVYLYQKPVSFNPLKGAQGAEQLTMSLMYDNLVTTGPDYEIIPRLAETWEVSDDAKTYTFHLAEGLTWSDGEPFTAEDVVFSYTLYADPTVGSAWRKSLQDVVGYDELDAGSADTLAGVVATDEHTVTITLSRPNAGFLSLIGYGSVFYVLPQHVLGDQDRAGLLENEFFSKPTVGMGPYVLDEFNVDENVVLSANEHFRTEVGIDTLYLKMLTTDVATAQLATGEIDLVQVSPLDLDAVEGLPGVTMESAPSPGFIRAALNFSKPEFQDKRVRQAMLHAIDRKGMIEGILGGHGSVLNSSIMTEWALPDDLNEYEYDPERAKTLLQESGVDLSREVKLSWVTGQRDRDQMVTVIIENLQAVGINAVANPVDAGALTASYEDKSYDLALFGGGVYTPDPASSSPMLACDQHFPAGSNTAMFCNEDLDTAFAAGAATAIPAERTAAYQEAARLDNEWVPYLWITAADTLWASSERLQGFAPHGDFTNGFWNAAEWSIAE